jgi:hypothetical protein
MSKSERTFTVQGSDIGESGGSYKGSSPSTAAKKAARILFNKVQKPSKGKAPKSIKFILRETTQRSVKKSYFYEGFVTYFDEPKIVSRGGIDISISREIKVKSCKEFQMKSVKSSGESPE